MNSNTQIVMEQPQNRRLTERLLRHWLKIRYGKPLPAESDLNPDDIAEIWSHCFLVLIKHQAEEKPKQFKYTYLGQGLIAICDGSDLDEELNESLISPYTQRVWDKFHEVFEYKRPVYDESEFTNNDNVVIKYRQILLPLSDDLGNINYILGGVKWKAS